MRDFVLTEIKVRQSITLHDERYILEYLDLVFKKTNERLISSSVWEIDSINYRAAYEISIYPDALGNFISYLYENTDPALFNEVSARAWLNKLWNNYETRGLFNRSIAILYLLYKDGYKMYYRDASGSFNTFDLPFCHDYLILIENVILNEHDGIPDKFKIAFIYVLRLICNAFGKAITYVVDKIKDSAVNREINSNGEYRVIS